MKQENLIGKELKWFFVGTVLLLYLVAFICSSPRELWDGMVKIVLSRDALITDYFELAGIGPAFLNTALVTTICTILVMVEKIPFTGATMAALFINIGYGLWGKNVLNILPILLGIFLYARLHHARLGRYIYTALFGTCLAPVVTELTFLLPFSEVWNLVIAVLLGIMVGFLLPPLSMHTASMHMGYSLFNVGFSAGILAFILVCILRSFGLESETVLVWQEGRPLWIMIAMYSYFVVTIIIGFFLSGRNVKKLLRIFTRPGRAIADFVLMDGAGASMMNMGLMGIIGLTYILLIGGDLSGPVVGAIFIVFGFSAFGAHVKNYLPVLAGVFLYSFISTYDLVIPGIQLAALFAVGLSPIAGQFGVVPGLASGMLHSAIVMCTAGMYGGLNLYNNGFSTGWVAIFMIPTIESFMKHFEDRKHRRAERKKKQEELV